MYEAVFELEHQIEFKIKETLIESNEEAKKLNFRGSPTILINNEDLEDFHAPDHPSLTCRYYSNGLPSTNEIKKKIITSLNSK